MKFNYDGMIELISEMVEICNKMLENANEMKNIAASVNSHFEWSGQAAEHFVKSLKNIDDMIYAISTNLSNAIQYEVLVSEEYLIQNEAIQQKISGQGVQMK